MASDTAGRSVFAMHFLAPLVLFLRFKRHGRNRARIKPLQADRFARDFAIPEFAIVDPADGGVDLAHQLALPVTGPQFQRTVRFLASAVGDVGDVAATVLQAVDGFSRLVQKLLLPGQPSLTLSPLRRIAPTGGLLS
jgi:hypothetical protein